MADQRAICLLGADLLRGKRAARKQRQHSGYNGEGKMKAHSGGCSWLKGR